MAHTPVTSDEGPEQLALVPSSVPATKAAPKKSIKKAKPAQQAAESLPVARIAVDTGLPHLDRYFDYGVPAELDAEVVPGCRVKVRFAGRMVDGFVVERGDKSQHEGRLAFLAKVVSPEPVLTPDVLALSRAVADRYAGVLGDVLRLAIPPRHARAEAQTRPTPPTQLPPAVADGWNAYESGASFMAALLAGESPRAVWNAVPGHDPARAVAQAALAMLHAGRGTIVCLPDQRDVARWDAVFADVLGDGLHVTLTAGQPPASRYRSFLALSRGDVQIVIGTRTAAFAPVADLGLVAIWDDGDDLFAEPRSPYPHARDVLLVRASEQKTAFLVGGYARTAEAQLLVDNGWARQIVADREVRRSSWPRLRLTDGTVDGSAPVRLPKEVFAAIRKASGPVLVQVPRRGYRESLSCQTCRTPARCRECQGPLSQRTAAQPIGCRWCGVEEPAWRCSHCHGTQLRAPVVGALRTAEEFARAFPHIDVVTSGGQTILDTIEPGRVLVLATPGAEPHVVGGYNVVILLDTWLMLARDDVRVEEESHRRWFNALALAGNGAVAVAVGEPTILQALVRADPVGFAVRELADRAETHLPPTGRLAIIDADDDVLAALADSSWTPHAEVLGPVAVDQRDPEAGDRLIIRVPRTEGMALAGALREVVSARSAAKQSIPRIQIDPLKF